MGKTWHTIGALVLLLGTLAPSLVEAQALGVRPTRLTLDTAGRPASVNLSNRAAVATMYQVQVFSWDDADDPEALSPTRDLLANPPVFTVDPGQEQIVRVGLRRPLADEVERSYRMIISEVPRETAVNGVALALRVNMPVFVAPEGAAPDIAWRVVEQGGAPVLQATNEGGAHLRLDRMVLAAADGQLLLNRGEGAPAYVLAGESRHWPLDQAPAGGMLTLEAETNRGPLSTRVTSPS